MNDIIMNYSLNTNYSSSIIKNIFLILIILFLSDLSLFAQSSAVNNGFPFITNYSSKEYKSHEQNWDIVQDKEGIMYFGNTYGILEYDGTHWRTIKMVNPDIVRSLTINKNGRIFVGGYGNFGYLGIDTTGNYRYVSLSDKLKDSNKNFTNVWKIHCLKEGILFRTVEALFQWNGERFKIWKSKNKFQFSSYINDTLYIQQNNLGLAKIVNDSLVLLQGGEFYAHKLIYLMIKKGKNNFIIGTKRNNLFIYNGKTSKSFKTEADQFLLKNKLKNGILLSNGMMAISTHLGGVAIINLEGKLIKIIDKSSGIRNNTIRNLFCDRQDGLWLALDNGLSRVQFPAPITYYDERSGLLGSVESIQRYNNRLFAATHQGLFSMNMGEGRLSDAYFTLNNYVRSWASIILKKDNSLYLSDNEQGTFELTNSEFRLISSYVVYTIKSSAVNKNLLYLGLEDGLAFLLKEDGKWNDKGKISLDLGPIRYIEDTENGSIWLGASKKVICKLTYGHKSIKPEYLLKPHIEYFDTDDGLPESSQYWVFKQAAKLIVGTDHGLYRYNKGNKRFFADTLIFIPPNNLNRSIERLTEDKNGNIWMFTIFNGINESGVARKLKNNKYSWDYIPFLPLKEFVVFAIHPDPDHKNVIWFGGPDGIVRYDMNIKKNYFQPFKTVIRNVYINNDSLVFYGHTSDKILQPLIKYRNNALRFEFAGLSFENEKENEYQYWLEGFDDKWSKWNNETRAVYTNIPEGDYVFRARAKNVYGIIGSEGHYAFTILPPWYREWPAYLIYLLFISASIMALIKLRSARLEKEKIQLQKLVEQRTEEIRLINIQLADKTNKMQELDQIKSRFFTNISHEFRTPLTLIIGPVEDMLNNTFKGDHRKAFKIIVRNARRLLRLINQLLDLSKIESGNMQLHTALTPIAPFVREIVASFTSLAETRKIHLQFIDISDELELCFDSDKLEKIIYNLISNAFKFTPDEGYIIIKLEELPASEKYPDGAVSIHVHDSGMGIPQDKMALIFNRFSMGDSTSRNRYDGSGIGLALTKELVEIHHGEIIVNSESGEGSEFNVILPKGNKHLRDSEIEKEVINKEAEDTMVNLELAELHNDIAINDFSQKEVNKENIQEVNEKEKSLVLIVEDNADVCSYIFDHLRDKYALLEARNGKIALELAREHLPDLIVSDVMMPEMDGFALCRAVKNDFLTSHIPLIMLTAKATKEAKFEGLETGADDYLTKPFDVLELEVRIKNIIESRKKLRDKYKRELLLEPATINTELLKDNFLKKLLNITEEKLTDTEFDTEQLVKEFSLGRRQVFRKIQALTGYTPGQFIRTIRLKRAFQLIKNKNGTVTEIAYEVGFSNLSYFTKCFREQFGKLPSEV
jgi:signal transduction histidine kinase/DNA-binding response OmpR family regulator